MRLEALDDEPIRRPNILMIVADDLGYNDISAINPGGIHTPHIDELASQSVVFTRHYADSVCAPSRVGLLTGREPERSGFRPGGLGIPEEFTTLPESLVSAGYRTRLVGKWHAGSLHRRSWPDRHGFQGWFGFLDQWRLQVPAARFGEQARPGYRDPWLQRDGDQPEKHEGHLTEILAAESTKYIRDQEALAGPWFLYHAFYAPHSPIQPAATFAARFDDTPRGRYSALVSQLDDVIGRLLLALRETGQADNTLVVLLSDNGGTNRQRDNNYPFHGAKAGVHEGTYRTPLIVHWPGQSRRHLDDRWVNNIDIYPTLMEFLGLPVASDLDGRSWLSRELPDREDVRFWEKFLPGLGTMSYSILSADGRWRLASQFGAEPELYDLDRDPTGHEDVAGKYPDVVLRLQSQYFSRRLAQALLPMPDNPGVLRSYSGYDLQRVPDIYGQTILFELLPGSSREQRALLQQPGVWWSSVDAGRVNFVTSFGQLGVSQDAGESCAVIGLVRYQRRPQFLGANQGFREARLYLNGELQGSLKDESEPPLNMEWPETQVLSSRIGQVRFFNHVAYSEGERMPYEDNRAFTEPVDLRASLDGANYPSVVDMSEGLCAEGRQ